MIRRKRVIENRFGDRREFFNYFKSIMRKLENLNGSNQFDFLFGDSTLATKIININQSVSNILRGVEDNDLALKELEEVKLCLKKYEEFLDVIVEDIDDLESSLREGI